MKRIITIYSALFFTICLFAQAPEKLSFQAIVRNSSGEPVRSSIVGMRIQILQGSEFGESVYIEKHIPITNVNGLVNIELGAGIVVSGNFASIDWGNGPYFLKTEIDPSGRTDYSITGISQLLSVPYALFAENSGTPGRKVHKAIKVIPDHRALLVIPNGVMLPEESIIVKALLVLELSLQLQL